MGLLDSLGSSVLKSLLGQDSSLLSSVLGEVLAGGGGGLSAIVARLEQAGMSDIVKSWLGNGENQPISTDQLKEVINSDQLKQLAEKFGIPLDDVLGNLAQILPEAVDRQSPTGKLAHDV
jgi:uncharacterized protein YidB (DUF937 family)